MTSQPASNEISEESIRTLVTAFYVKVRKDPLLAPVFASRISAKDWPHHENHIADFWSSIFLKTGRFSGNPMRKHLALSGVTPQHFERWLELFCQTAKDTLTNSQAKHADAMARRIAQSFQMGLAFHRENSGQEDHPFRDFSIHRKA